MLLELLEKMKTNANPLYPQVILILVLVPTTFVFGSLSLRFISLHE